MLWVRLYWVGVNRIHLPPFATMYISKEKWCTTSYLWQGTMLTWLLCVKVTPKFPRSALLCGVITPWSGEITVSSHTANYMVAWDGKNICFVFFQIKETKGQGSNPIFDLICSSFKCHLQYFEWDAIILCNTSLHGIKEVTLTALFILTNTL